MYKLFEGIKDHLLNYPEQGVKGIGNSIIAMLSALEMINIAKKYGDILYDVNVRLYLGSKGRNKSLEKNKVMIIDGDTVITGSFGFTKAAKMNNAEDLVIRDK